MAPSLLCHESCVESDIKGIKFDNIKVLVNTVARPVTFPVLINLQGDGHQEYPAPDSMPSSRNQVVRSRLRLSPQHVTHRLH